MTLIDQIVRIYVDREKWHKNKLGEKEAQIYFERVIDLGLLITISDIDKLIGYVEFWRIDYEQFGRIVCGENISPMDNNFTTGYIAYVANTYVIPEYRKTDAIKALRDRFFEANRACTYFVGEARRKKTGLVKVFKREDIYGKRKIDSDSLTEHYADSNSNA